MAVDFVEIKDLVDLLVSDNYKDRFVGEYHELYTRLCKLENMIEKYKKGTLNFIPKCPIEILEQQASIMSEYLLVLESRATIEEIDLRK